MEENIQRERKFKEGKYCGFREKNQCNSYCGLYNVGLGACCFHSINLNLQTIANEIKERKQKDV